MNSPLYALFSVVVDLASWLIFLRFIFQLAEVHKKNPYAAPIYRLSAVVDMFERIFPTVAKGRVNSAALVLLLLLQFVALWGKTSILGSELNALQLFFAGTILSIAKFLTVLRWTIFVSILASFAVMFSQKIHPIVDIAMQLGDPIIEPFRKISPNLGMIDLAPLIALLVLSFAKTALLLVTSPIFGAL